MKFENVFSVETRLNSDVVEVKLLDVKKLAKDLLETIDYLQGIRPMVVHLEDLDHIIRRLTTHQTLWDKVGKCNVGKLKLLDSLRVSDARS